MPSVTVRAATSDELADVLNVLENGLLSVSVPELRSALDAGDVLVAVETTAILGALVLVGREITAIAVRRRRRDQGIGRRLVEQAAHRRPVLVAAFDERVRPFWESLGFAVEPTDEQGRFRGHRPAGDGTGEERVVSGLTPCRRLFRG